MIVSTDLKNYLKPLKETETHVPNGKNKNEHKQRDQQHSLLKDSTEQGSTFSIHKLLSPLEQQDSNAPKVEMFSPTEQKLGSEYTDQHYQNCQFSTTTQKVIVKNSSIAQTTPIPNAQLVQQLLKVPLQGNLPTTYGDVIHFNASKVLESNPTSQNSLPYNVNPISTASATLEQCLMLSRRACKSKMFFELLMNSDCTYRLVNQRICQPLIFCLNLNGESA